MPELAPGRGRLPALDGMRALAALTVVGYHVGLATGLARSGTFAGLVADLKAGVCVFFLISGLSLYLPYARALRDGAPVPGRRTYARRRALRILPAYWLVLAVWGIALPASGAFGPDGWRYWLLAQIYDPSTLLGGTGVGWSLCVEVSFYLVLPALAAAVRFAATRLHRGAAVELGAFALLGLASIALRAGLCGGPLAAAPGSAGTVLIALPGSLDWFCLGMALAVVAAALEAGSALPGRLAALAGRPGTCWGLAAALYLAAAAIEPQDLLVSLLDPSVHVLLGLCAALLLLPAVAAADPARSRITSALAHRRAVWLGTISYGIYLWHMLVLDAILGGPMHPRATPSAPAAALGLLLVGLVGAVACGAASWYFVERPLQRRGARAASPRRLGPWPWPRRAGRGATAVEPEAA